MRRFALAAVLAVAAGALTLPTAAVAQAKAAPSCTAGKVKTTTAVLLRTDPKKSATGLRSIPSGTTVTAYGFRYETQIWDPDGQGYGCRLYKQEKYNEILCHGNNSDSWYKVRYAGATGWINTGCAKKVADTKIKW
ncbi:hypothetical protein NLX83_08860 [Allokutzneria sp. A3M-2-11 16]|uniref:hypothetical protein n=1 Tax=Allokutzneria sp. A3M-2-11 16 TaxID=2962043 RepID=UPI0020B87C2A|nr:hypothetical protein [Allokutzneria sp. A3M-2-11 16]MCP3799363.1 hypothetical protein [Allokutzneria sp. A3M-2-11 16]